MISPCHNTKLIFRVQGARNNPANIGRRAGVKILKLKCPSCGEKYLATDAEHSHPYQVRKRLPPEQKKVRLNVRLEYYKLIAIRKRFGSEQKWLDRLSVDVVH